MAKKKENQQHIGDVIQAYLETYRLKSKLTELDLKNAWEAIMGTSIARHTTDIKLNKQVMIIKLNSSVLRQELSYGKDKIANSVNEYFKESIVKEVLLV